METETRADSGVEVGEINAKKLTSNSFGDKGNRRLERSAGTNTFGSR